MTDEVKDIIREQIKRCAEWSVSSAATDDDSVAFSRAIASLSMVLVEAERVEMSKGSPFPFASVTGTVCQDSFGIPVPGDTIPK